MPDTLSHRFAGLPIRHFFPASAWGAAALALAMLWSWWPTLTGLAEVWNDEEAYSHGWLVPVFAAVLLWQRRGMLADAQLQFNPWGVAILLVAAVLHLAGGYFAFLFPDRVSLLIALAGLAVILGSWKALAWSWPGIAFLLFMIPLPLGLGRLMQPSLQRLATACSTYTLQTIGFPAVPEGNIILLHEARIGVVEACGGLSMLLVFFALATAVALLTSRPMLDRIIIVASAIPIALAANVARITITAILHDQVGEWAGESFHDLAGWFMMPLALGILWIELRLLAWVLVADAPG